MIRLCRKGKTSDEKSLELLDTDYIDLMFIHQPAGDFMAGCRKLVTAYKEGKIKSIGISIHTSMGKSLRNFLRNARSSPMLNREAKTSECNVVDKISQEKGLPF